MYCVHCRGEAVGHEQVYELKKYCVPTRHTIHTGLQIEHNETHLQCDSGNSGPELHSSSRYQGPEYRRTYLALIDVSSLVLRKAEDRHNAAVGLLTSCVGAGTNQHPMD